MLVLFMSTAMITRKVPLLLEGIKIQESVKISEMKAFNLTF
jgi:hypothetical protein